MRDCRHPEFLLNIFFSWLAGVDETLQLSRGLSHPAFATKDETPFRDMLGDFPREFGPLQFWTEAAVLSQAGIDAVVIGPGNIEQAHAAAPEVVVKGMRQTDGFVFD